MADSDPLAVGYYLFCTLQTWGTTIKISCDLARGRHVVAAYFHYAADFSGDDGSARSGCMLQVSESAAVVGAGVLAFTRLFRNKYACRNLVSYFGEACAMFPIY